MTAGKTRWLSPAPMLARALHLYVTLTGLRMIYPYFQLLYGNCLRYCRPGERGKPSDRLALGAEAGKIVSLFVFNKQL